MSAIRVGAVQYLNARPLVYGLDDQKELFSIDFDVPAKCASLLHERSIDLGLIPTIEYLRKPDYRLVPDIGVVSHGPVATVLRILCAEWFDIEPNFHTMAPDLDAMLKRCDAALLIGDTALFTEHETVVDLDKIDLGEEWTAMTSLPFVWAVWSGRDGVVKPEHLAALGKARDAGVKVLDQLAAQFGPKEEAQAELAREYLQKNVQFALTEDCHNGIKRYFELALEMGIFQHSGSLQFYEK